MLFLAGSGEMEASGPTISAFAEACSQAIDLNRHQLIGSLSEMQNPGHRWLTF